MAEVKIIYWSGTGNTAAMAQSVADGVAAAGAEAKIIPVENASAADIADVKAFALGCPSMGAEQLEESSMEPFVDEILGSVSGSMRSSRKSFSCKCINNIQCADHTTIIFNP